MKKNRNFPKGLTLVEMLVVVIIIMLVMTIGANTYRNQRKHVIYTDTVAKIASMIKTARDYALNSRSVYDGCQALEPDKVYVPEEGYGVYISHSDIPGESRAVLFANTFAGTEEQKHKYNEGSTCNSDLIEEDFTIPGEADLVGLWLDLAEPDHTALNANGGNTDDELTIIFRPPLAEATITINDTSPTITKLNEVYIQFRRPQAPASVPSKYIYFNKVARNPEIETQ